MYEELHCPFCGSTEISVNKETYNYKAGFWGLIFLNAIGMLLFAPLAATAAFEAFFMNRP